MKKLALCACLVSVLVLGVFFGVLALTNEAVATVYAWLAVATIVLVSTFTTSIPKTTVVVAIVAVIAASIIAFFATTTIIVAVAVVALLIVVIAITNVVDAVTRELKMPRWRLLLVCCVEAVSIFGGIVFFVRVGWWSVGIGSVGIMLIIAFWQWCEWYDRRHAKTTNDEPLVDTLHNDPP